MPTYPDEVRALGPPAVLTAEQRESFWRDGYVVIPGERLSDGLFATLNAMHAWCTMWQI
jgi:hypothetical protein